MQLLIKHAVQALARLDADARRQWELHVVAHSAGSIYAAYALEQLTKLGVSFRTLTFMAPAITTALFKARMLQPIVTGDVPMPTMFILSDQGERDDNVGPYGKSLLYLVSNAFEGRRDVPILGMQRFIERLPAERVQPDPDLVKLFARTVDGRPAVVITGVESADPASRSKSDTHGGFDNDESTMNSVLRRILGEEPKRLFTIQDLQY
jgi:pimeloyl-ACP methyl ester carboxylesterase